MNKDSLEILRRCADAFEIKMTAREISLFDVFAEELKKWNRKINLTAIKNDQEIVIKHFADSLSLLVTLNKSGTLLDIGSGGGFPAIPLKIMLPHVSVVSVDAVEKKVLFQRHAVRLLQLENFSALHVRAEELRESNKSQFDYVVSRAFSDLPHFVSLALPLLKDSGRIIAMKGRGGREETAAAEKQFDELGVEVVDCIQLKLPVSGDDRYLVVMKKIAAKNAE
ncbi:MAG: 16S rRNA (guanine(527)-N(7))-methyltransferase RsmG [Geobacteraceae bacterium]|nr:16S rRNA (guanine(527)-N(7))-methyltransferase RsmG [Geobacteraceae bacterium]